MSNDDTGFAGQEEVVVGKPIEEKKKPVGVNKFFYKNGQFSKTATFAVLGNTVVLFLYAFLSLFGGAEFDLKVLHGILPTFNSGDALTILATLNGTYLLNNSKLTSGNK